jgi:hypothetical protein
MFSEASYRLFFLIYGFLAAVVSSDFAAAEEIFGRLLGRKWHGGSSSNPKGYTPLLLFRSNDKESKLTMLYIYKYICIYIYGVVRTVGIYFEEFD